MLISIEGLDGTGKHTQSVLLKKAIDDGKIPGLKGIPTSLVSFPRYESESSSLVNMYLQGRITKNPNEVNPYLASLFYACDRGISYQIEDWRKDSNHKVIIADRYTGSNYIHQMSKLPKYEYKKYLDFMFDLEYNKLNLPKPDITFYLMSSINKSQELMTDRYNGNENSKDIHESNVEYLKQCLAVAGYLRDHLGWVFIDEIITEDGQSYLRPPEDINDEINKCINRMIE